MKREAEIERERQRETERDREREREKARERESTTFTIRHRDHLFKSGSVLQCVAVRCSIAAWCRIWHCDHPLKSGDNKHILGCA